MASRQYLLDRGLLRGEFVSLLLFALLAGRLYWLQVVRHEHFLTLAENNRLRIRTIRAWSIVRPSGTTG
mgnify:CR=1 FL=1